jgi:hypothetical protein
MKNVGILESTHKVNVHFDALFPPPSLRLGGCQEATDHDDSCALQSFCERFVHSLSRQYHYR